MAFFTCEKCGTTFKAKPGKRRKYCSRKCYFSEIKGRERPSMKGRAAWNRGLSAESDERIARGVSSRLKNPVDETALRELYIEQNLPMKVIGERYGVSKQVIKRLAAEYGLTRKRDDLTPSVLSSLYDSGLTSIQIGERYNCSGGYVQFLLGQYGIRARKTTNQARVKPDLELLQRLYWGEWKSYDEIAGLLGVDLSTIPYWLKKFNIPRRSVWETRRGPDWQPPDIETIKHLYEAEGLGTDSIGQIFGVSKSHISHILKSVGVQLRKTGYPNVAHYITKDGDKVRSGLELQVDDWLYEHGLAHIYEPVITGTNYRADFLVAGTYIEIWGIASHEKYDQRREKKLATYAKLNLTVLSVYRKDLPRLKVLDSLLTD